MATSKVTKRKQIEKTLHRLRASGGDADAAKIEKLEKAIQKTDEQLEQDTTLEGDLDVVMADTNEGEASGGPQQEAATDQTKGNAASEETHQNAASGDPPRHNAGSSDPTPAAAADRTGGQGAHKSVEANAKTSREIKSESSEDESALFVPEASEDDEDPEYGEALFTRPGPKYGDNVKTIGWTSGSRRPKFINQYGKKSAARYRLEGSADTAEYEESLESEDRKKECVSLPKNRFGDRKIEGTNKWKFTKRHIVAIYGVAWEGAGKGDPEEDLSLIEPCEGRPRWPATYVLVAWLTGTYVDANGEQQDKIEKAWETRATLRSRWTKTSADKSIYAAACESEARYQEAVTGKRRAFSRTPSTGLADEETRQLRQRSLAADQTAVTGHRSSAMTAQNRSSTPETSSTVSDVTMSLAQFRTDYCAAAGVETFSELSPHDKADFMKTWRLMAPTMGR